MARKKSQKALVRELVDSYVTSYQNQMQQQFEAEQAKNYAPALPDSGLSKADIDGMIKSFKPQTQEIPKLENTTPTTPTPSISDELKRMEKAKADTTTPRTEGEQKAIDTYYNSLLEANRQSAPKSTPTPNYKAEIDRMNALKADTTANRTEGENKAIDTYLNGLVEAQRYLDSQKPKTNKVTSTNVKKSTTPDKVTNKNVKNIGTVEIKADGTKNYTKTMSANEQRDYERAMEAIAKAKEREKETAETKVIPAPTAAANNNTEELQFGQLSKQKVKATPTPGKLGAAYAQSLVDNGNEQIANEYKESVNESYIKNQTRAKQATKDALRNTPIQNNVPEYDDRGFRTNQAIINEYLNPTKKLTASELEQAENLIRNYENSDLGKKNENATTLVFDENHPDGISVPMYAVDENGNYDPRKELSPEERAYQQSIGALKTKVSDGESALVGAMQTVPFVDALEKAGDVNGEYANMVANSQRQNPLAYTGGLLAGGLASNLAGQYMLNGTQYGDQLAKLLGADKSVARQIATDALVDAPVDLATDIIPTLAADFASGKDLGQVALNTLENIGLNAGLNAGSALLSNAGDIKGGLKEIQDNIEEKKWFNAQRRAALANGYDYDYKGVPIEYSDSFAEPEKLVNSLTGQQVSPEYANAIRKLESGVGITSEEYNAIPEVVDAKKRVKNAGKETFLDKSPEREALRSQWLDDLEANSGSAIRQTVDGKEKTVYNGTVRKDRRADIIFGLPSSGKSSAVVDPISYKYKSRLIDSDEAKKLIPEFDHGWGAGRVHEESSDLADRLLARSVAKGENIVIPKVGGKYESIDKLISKFRNEGYEVYLHFNDLDPNKAAARNLRRFASQGRFLDLDTTSFKYGNEPSNIFEKLVREGKADGYTRVSNDVRMGEYPVQLKGTESISFDWGHDRPSGGKYSEELGQIPSPGEATPTTASAGYTQSEISSPLKSQPQNEGGFFDAQKVTTPDVNDVKQADEITPDVVNKNELSGIDKSDEAALDKDIEYSKVYTNSLQENRIINMANKADQINAQYNKHYQKDVVETAKNRLIKNPELWEKAYSSGEEAITSDADVATAFMLLSDKQAQIDDLVKNGADMNEISKLVTEKNILARRLRAAGTEKGQAIKAFDYFNGTADGAILNANRLLDSQAEKWAKRNKNYKKVQSAQKAAEEITDSIVNERSTGDALRDRIRQIINTKHKDFADQFSDSDIEYLANLADFGASKKELENMMNTKMATGVFDVPEETVQKVNKLFESAQKLPVNSRLRVNIETQAFWELANCTGGKASLADKFEAWRFLAMLGNTKTHARNIIGNAIFGKVTNISDSVAGLMEEAADRTSKRFRNGQGIDRTKAILTNKDSDLVKACDLDADLNAHRQLSGSKWDDTRGVQSAIKEQKEVFDSKFFQKYNRINNKALSGEDTFAMKNKYKTSLAGYLKANGVDQSIFKDEEVYRKLMDESALRKLTDAETAQLEALSGRVGILDKAREYAIKKAEYAAFHEDNKVADVLSKISRTLNDNDSGAVRALGKAYEGVLPFKKTPANILRSGLEYSPLNILQDAWTIANMKNGKKNISDLFDSMSKTITGTGLTVMGMWLYDKGLLKMSDEDTKWQDNLEGNQNYSVTIPIGDKKYTYTVDWAAPSIMPVLLGAQIKKMHDANIENEPDSAFDYIGEALQAASKLISPIAETSMLSGISDTIDSIAQDNKLDALMNLGLTTTTGYLQQGIPTVGGQIARLVDPTRRSTYSGQDESVARTLDNRWKKIENKVPFLSRANEAYYDTYGRTQTNSPYDYISGDSYDDRGFKQNKPDDYVLRNIAGALGNTLYQMGSPGYIQKVEETDADKMARDIYNDKAPKYDDRGFKTEDISNEYYNNPSTFASRNMSKTVNGERISEEENAKYSKAWGESNLSMRNSLANSEWFNSLDRTTQGKILDDIDSLSDDIGEASFVENYKNDDKLYNAYKDGGEQGAFEKLQAKYNPYGISEDAYNKMLENGDDLSKLEGYKETLEKNGLSDKEAYRNAYINGGKKGFNEEVQYQNALEKYGLSNTEKNREYYDKGSLDFRANYVKTWKDRGLEDFDSKSAQSAYYSKDYDTYVDYRKWLKDNELSDSEERWTDYKKYSQEITTLLPTLSEYGMKNDTSSIDLYNSAKQRASSNNVSISPEKFATTFSSINKPNDKGEYDSKLSQKEVIAYLNECNMTEKKGKEIWNIYLTDPSSSTIPVLEGNTWKTKTQRKKKK